MRRRIAIGIVVVAALAAGIAFFVLRDDAAPFPSASVLRTRGLAVWPADTVQEAKAACEDPQPWHLDARATAERFTEEVLRYPAPFTTAWTQRPDRPRYLVNTKGVRRVFLGVVVDLQRFGRCWYIVNVEPREGGIGTSVMFVHPDGEPHLLLGHNPLVRRARIGYGSWTRELEQDGRQTIVELPKLPADATGHVIHIGPGARGISDTVGAQALGTVPQTPARAAPEVLDPAELRGDARVCRLGYSARRGPRPVIRHLYEWTFKGPVDTAGGAAKYSSKGVHRQSRDRWRLRVDRAILDVSIRPMGKRCWALASMVARNHDEPLRALRAHDDRVTFDIQWGTADAAYVAFVGGRGGASTLVRRIEHPVTFKMVPPPAPDLPAYALVILYRQRDVVSAQYALYEMS